MNGYSVVKKLDTGGSPVIKTIIERDGRLFVHRKYNPLFMKNRLLSFELRQNISDVNMPKIEEIGADYAIFEYIDGYSLDKSEDPSYYSQIIAEELRKLHRYESSDTNILEKFKKSIESKLSKIDCLNPSQLDLIRRYIEDNVGILNGRTASIVHGDFHPGNIIVNDGKPFLIDLDVLTYDEKHRDLVNIFGNYQDFYNCLYLCYFDGSIPKDSYLIIKLYSILLILDYINYSKRQYGDVSKGLKVFDNYLESTNNLKSIKPKWMI